jgi:preprotein translocase subunit SecA
MSFWNWLLGRGVASQPACESRVWLSSEALWQELAGELQQEWQLGRQIIVVSHFPESHEQLLDWLDRQTFNHEEFRPRNLNDFREAIQRNPRQIWLIESARLPRELSSDPFGQSSPVTIMATEHHPHPEADAVVTRLAAALMAEGGATVQCALDQALLAHLGASLEQVLRAIGARDDTPIVSGMVTRQIRNLQRNIGRKVPDCQPASSAAEWMRRYVPA